MVDLRWIYGRCQRTSTNISKYTFFLTFVRSQKTLPAQNCIPQHVAELAARCEDLLELHHASSDPPVPAEKNMNEIDTIAFYDTWCSPILYTITNTFRICLVRSQHGASPELGRRARWMETVMYIFHIFPHIAQIHPNMSSTNEQDTCSANLSKSYLLVSWF